MKRRVLVETPYRGDIAENVAYAKLAVADSIKRGEAPLASHVLIAAHGILDDADEADRRQGIGCGLAWLPHAQAVVLYVDRGVSPGMQEAKSLAETLGIPVEERRLPS